MKSSRARICWLMALWVRSSLRAALEKLPLRAAWMKAFIDCTDGYRLYMLLVLLTPVGRNRRWLMVAEPFNNRSPGPHKDGPLFWSLTMIEFTVNGERRELDEASPSMPLLWVLRDHLKLTGTKFGCGMGLCGACTVHLDGVAVRSCQLP